MNRRGFASTALTALAGFTHCAYANEAELRVAVEPVLTATAQQTLRALSARAPGLVSDSDVRRLAARPGRAVYAALGPQALQGAFDAGVDGPLLALLTSNEAFRRAVSQAANDTRRHPVSALYGEPAPLHQMTLARAIFRRRVTVCTLLSSHTAHLEPAMRHAARQASVDLEACVLEPGENAVRRLALFDPSWVLLAIPDPTIYTPESIRGLLEATYRKSQPVLGFSAALVRAGTLASVYSTAEDVAAQALALSDQLALGQAPAPQYPAQWRVVVNDSVARSLNIWIDAEARSLASTAR